MSFYGAQTMYLCFYVAKLAHVWGKGANKEDPWLYEFSQMFSWGAVCANVG